MNFKYKTKRNASEENKALHANWTCEIGHVKPTCRAV